MRVMVKFLLFIDNHNFISIFYILIVLLFMKILHEGLNHPIPLPYKDTFPSYLHLSRKCSLSLPKIDSRAFYFIIDYD